VIDDVDGEAEGDEHDRLLVGNGVGNDDALGGGPCEALLQGAVNGRAPQHAGVGAQVGGAAAAPLAMEAGRHGVGDDAGALEPGIDAAPDGGDAGDELRPGNVGLAEPVGEGGALAKAQGVHAGQADKARSEQQLEGLRLAAGGDVLDFDALGIGELDDFHG